MTNKDPQILVDLARSWNYPAQMEVDGSDWQNKGYDYTQRAYILKTNSNPTKLELTLQSSPVSPVVNPAFVLHNWSIEHLKLVIDGEYVPNGKDFRYGIEYDIDGNPLVVVWIKYQSEKPLKISILGEQTI
jgi:hypothetical protein